MQRVNRRSKMLNDYLERGFFKIGSAVAEWPYLFLIIVVAVCLGFSIGLVRFSLITDVFVLWTPKTSAYYQEKQFFDDVWGDRETSLLALACRHKDGYEDILDEKYVKEYFNFHLDLMTKSPKKTYTAHYTDGSTLEIPFSFYGESWKEPKSLDTIKKERANGTRSDYPMKILPLCNPWVNSPLEAQFELNCYSLDIFHCFAEGGTFFPFENYLSKTFFTNLVAENPYMNKSSFQGLSKVELGSILGPSCEMWAGKRIPANYIYGGEERINESDSTSRLLSVRSYETLLYIDSPYNLVRKTYIQAKRCTPTATYAIRCLEEPTDQEIEDMTDFVNDWLKDFIDFMLDYLDEYEEDETHLLKPLFFTSRTSSDLLTEAFNSNLYLVAIAYILMLIFVSCTGCRPRNLFYSRGEASFAGMIIVFLSVVASMGLGAVFLTFSPNVVQVLPFIAVGLGVDDMYVMLQSFYFNKEWSAVRMVAESLRVSGPSVTLTTLANFLAFLVASFMPLPDVNRFAQFGMIMVVIHYFVMIFGFSSVLTLLARRMLNGYNDFSWLGCWQPGTRTKNPIKSQKPPTNESSVLDPLYDFFTRDDIRIVLFVLFCVFFGAGLYGVGLIHVGLPLDSIVPASYGQDYLEVRGKYFFSYINSIFSDAYRSDAKPIDWQNKFEMWINQTETVTSKVDTDLVYRDKTVHSFWAWDMRDYNIKNYQNYFTGNGYTATFYTPPTSAVKGNSTSCETDRLDYCGTLDANYTYGTSLYKCLWFNKAQLDSVCSAYLDEITPVTSTPAIAKQVQLYCLDDESVAGLYTSPSSDVTNVFYRSDGAIIYQRTDLTWAILGVNGDLKFISGPTQSGSQPPQHGWMNPDKEIVGMALLFYDTTYYNYGVKRENPQTTDDPARSVFKISHDFTKGASNSGGCYSLDAMKKSMSKTNTFERIRLSDGTEDNSIQCGTTLDSTYACKAIRDGTNSGALKCGSAEHHGGNSRWWVGNCGSQFTIAASTQTLDDDEACFCTSGVSGGQTNSYAQFCGGSNFGGLNIDTAGSTSQCGAVDQTIAVECEALSTCDSLEACYYYVANSSANDCGAFRITLYEAEGSAGGFGPCLLKGYNSLSSCCQQAVRKNIIDTNTCYQIGVWSNYDSTVCTLKDTCGTSCTRVCYGSQVTYGAVNSDCREEIETTCSTFWDAGDQAGFETCMDDITDSNTTSSTCCMNTYASEKTDYSGCLIPRATYYDYDQSRYDISDCSGQTAGASCGAYTGAASQVTCMLDAYDADPDSITGCCQIALETITNSYFFTRECAGDIDQYCSDSSTVGDVTTACANDLKTNMDSLSSNCYDVLTNCPEDGIWPITAVGATVELDCATTQTGKRTRQCHASDSSSPLLPYWATVNEDGCVTKRCPAETDSDGQKWLSTAVGNVAGWLGTDTKVSCTAVATYGYNHRYCGLASNNSAVWSAPEMYCRAAYLQWDSAETLNTTCDPTKSSMLFVRPRMLGETYADALSECQNGCLVGNLHCDTIVYDNSTDLCTAYDWCVPIVQDVKTLKLFRAPTTFPEWIASACSPTLVKPSVALNERGIPHPACFYAFLWEYLVDPQGGAKSLDSFVVNNRLLLYSETAFQQLRINSSKNSVAVQGIEDDMIGTQFIMDLRDWADKHLIDNELWVALYGLLFDLDTQYIHVTRYFVTNLLLCIIAVMVAGLLFLIHPMAACVVLLVEVVMVIEVYGFVDWADLHMNGILTLNMLVSIGLTMEFAAHIARAFMMASAKPGEKIGIPNALPGQIRMKKALREMFTPVTLTAITTFIGIAPIASASFPYFRDYYFVLYVMMILTGWVNGAVFQPVILSFLNPGTFSHDSDRKSTNRATSMPTSTQDSTRENP